MNKKYGFGYQCFKSFNMRIFILSVESNFFRVQYGTVSCKVLYRKLQPFVYSVIRISLADVNQIDPSLLYVTLQCLCLRLWGLFSVYIFTTLEIGKPFGTDSGSSKLGLIIQRTPLFFCFIHNLEIDDNFKTVTA